MQSCLYILLLSTQWLQLDIVTVNADDLVLKANNSSTLIVHVNVKNGYHIQANQVSNELLIPTTITLAGDSYLKSGKAIFPKAKKMHLEGTDDWLEVYDGRFQIKIPMNTTEASKGRYELQAQIHYQACDARTCFFPKTIPFTISYRIE